MRTRQRELVANVVELADRAKRAFTKCVQDKAAPVRNRCGIAAHENSYIGGVIVCRGWQTLRTPHRGFLRMNKKRCASTKTTAEGSRVSQARDAGEGKSNFKFEIGNLEGRMDGRLTGTGTGGSVSLRSRSGEILKVVVGNAGKTI